MDAEIHFLVKHKEIVIYDDWFCNTKRLFTDVEVDRFTTNKNTIIDNLNKFLVSEYFESDNVEIVNKMLSILNEFNSEGFTFLLTCCVW